MRILPNPKAWLIEHNAELLGEFLDIPPLFPRKKNASHLQSSKTQKNQVIHNLRGNIPQLLWIYRLLIWTCYSLPWQWTVTPHTFGKPGHLPSCKRIFTKSITLWTDVFLLLNSIKQEISNLSCHQRSVSCHASSVWKIFERSFALSQLKWGAGAVNCWDRTWWFAKKIGLLHPTSSCHIFLHNCNIIVDGENDDRCQISESCFPTLVAIYTSHLAPPHG